MNKHSDLEDVIVEDSSYDTGSIKITLRIDGYDDIFSTFDHRDVSVRTISDDFVHECQKYVLKLMSDEIITDTEQELAFLLPEEVKRNLQTEEKIIVRLSNYFKNKLIKLRKNRKNRILRSFVLFCLGVCFTFLTGYIDHVNINKEDKSYWPLALLSMILQFLGWFLAWDNLSNIFYLFFSSQELKQYKFFSLAATLKISFIFYVSQDLLSQ